MANVERTGSHRILKGTSGLLAITVYSDGAKVDPTDQSVTAVDDTGASVTLGAAAAAGSGSGLVTATIAPAQTASVGRITATWVLTVGLVSQQFTTYHEIVGDLLFTEAEMRAFNAGGGGVANEKYTDAMILAAHDLVKESFETKCGVAFGLTFDREIVNGSGTAQLIVGRHKIQTVRDGATRSGTTWTALTEAELDSIVVDDYGILTVETGAWPEGVRNIRLDLEHGYQPIPLEVKEAAKMLAREWLVGSPIPARATSTTTTEGTFVLATPGFRGSVYGLPMVDRIIGDYQKKHAPGFGY